MGGSRDGSRWGVSPEGASCGGSRGILPRRFYALVPIPKGWKKRGRRCGQPPPALRSRPLGRRSGCSSAEPYPPPSASSVGGSVPGRGPFRSLFIYSGERERSRGGQPQRCQPAGVRRSRPARSSDSRASPKRSFFTPSASRSFARESTTPGVSRSSTWSWRGRCC